MRVPALVSTGASRSSTSMVSVPVFVTATVRSGSDSVSEEGPLWPGSLSPGASSESPQPASASGMGAVRLARTARLVGGMMEIPYSDAINPCRRSRRPIISWPVELKQRGRNGSDRRVGRGRVMDREQTATAVEYVSPSFMPSTIWSGASPFHTRGANVRDSEGNGLLHRVGRWGAYEWTGTGCIPVGNTPASSQYFPLIRLYPFEMCPGVSLSEKCENKYEQVGLDTSYLVLMTMSGVLAGVALLTNSIPILIGAMVIAPVLTPLELVSAGLAANRLHRARFGVSVAVVGLLAATAGAIVTTLGLNLTGVLPPAENLIGKPLLEERITAGWFSVVAAAAAGIAAGVTTDKDRQDTLVGVVAALALVPAAAAGGITLLSQAPARASGGLLLLLLNAGMVVVTGTVTLWLGARGDRKADTAK
ncbi:hypothetical protein HARCEL1_11285 [Halococcoides cellulosivorans]|uniref:DUF389 domain-containing protein n=2 Tax=Halococcoides cellulosivorans TaxID=1679096 RepID=A0A2R4X379_9EURY|nr:hypothetical protein HARCEL1_11285 [Halococcoides cellulosivorans]